MYLCVCETKASFCLLKLTSHHRMLNRYLISVNYMYKYTDIGICTSL